jgi:hypothetical protein
MHGFACSRLALPVLIISVLAAAGEPAHGEHVWHVSPAGKDGNPGTHDRPFATVEAARDRIREVRKTKQTEGGPHTILLGPGVHHRTAPLELDERDGGLTIRGPADRSARLHAGRFIPAAAWRPVTDAARRGRFDSAAADHVVSLDLAAVGVRTFKEPPVLFTDGGGLPDLYVGDTPLPLSRWPNEGHAVMEKVLDRGTWSGKPADRRAGVFTSAREPHGEWRPNGWRGADGVRRTARRRWRALSRRIFRCRDSSASLLRAGNGP